MKEQLKKDFFWNTIGSLINSFTSLFFLLIIVRINGVEQSGIFTFAFSTAVLFQIVGMYSGRAFQVTEVSNDIHDSDYIISRYITCSIMIICGIIFCFTNKYEIFKIQIMLILLIYKMIEAFSDVLYGIIQKNNRLYVVGRSLFFKGILGIFSLLIVDLLTNSLLLASLSLIVVNLLVLLFYDLPNFKNCDYIRSKFNFKIFKIGFDVFLVTFLTQYLINAPKFAIDNNLSHDYQSIYGIISMPATFMALCAQFLIHPFLNKIKNHLKTNEYGKINSITIKLSMVMIFIGFFTIIIAYLLGIPVLQLIYGVKLYDYLLPFMLIITGSVIYGITIIFQNTLIALRTTKIQSLIFIIDSIIALIFSNYLVRLYSLLGASIMYLISMLILFILYIVVYIFKMKNILKESSYD